MRPRTCKSSPLLVARCVRTLCEARFQRSRKPPCQTRRPRGVTLLNQSDGSFFNPELGPAYCNSCSVTSVSWCKNDARHFPRTRVLSHEHAHLALQRSSAPVSTSSAPRDPTRCRAELADQICVDTRALTSSPRALTRAPARQHFRGSTIPATARRQSGATK